MMADGRTATTPASSLLSDPEMCAACGHSRSLHYGRGFQQSGWQPCMATVDTRPLAAGGDTLAPCSCKGFESELKA